MGVMKIENYETWKTDISADTFNWAYNPISVDFQSIGNEQITKLPFANYHIITSGGGHEPPTIVLTGHFSGTNKMDNYRSLSKHFHEGHLLKKLYFEDDKFLIGIGKNIKRTHVGGRTNFVDYVAIFQSLFGIQFGDSEKTSNSGNVTTFITYIYGTVDNGAQDIIITDKIGNELKISSDNLNTNDVFVYRLVSFVESVSTGIYITNYGYCTINGTAVNSITKGLGLLSVLSGDDVSTITISNLNNVTIYLRDGWSI